MIQDISAEQLAKLFHLYREALAHDGGGHGSKEESSSWDRTPQNERKIDGSRGPIGASRIGRDTRGSRPGPEVLRQPW